MTNYLLYSNTVRLLQLMIALRFGSESYAKGDPGRAKAAFAEALDLFVLTGTVPLSTL